MKTGCKSTRNMPCSALLGSCLRLPCVSVTSLVFGAVACFNSMQVMSGTGAYEALREARIALHVAVTQPGPLTQQQHDEIERLRENLARCESVYFFGGFLRCRNLQLLPKSCSRGIAVSSVSFIGCPESLQGTRSYAPECEFHRL